MNVWLIEDDGPVYWCGGNDFGFNVECAVRLARKEDAERVLRHLPKPDKLRVVAHGWAETTGR
jgi:hypothetical protein